MPERLPLEGRPGSGKTTAVIALMDRPVAVVATVHAQRHPFTDELKRRPSVAVMRLTPSNRDELPVAMASRLRG